MSLREDRKGFIFSLDATLAVLVVLVVMAGVARAAGPGLVYGQHGYLRLERYANDALEVMQLKGTLDIVANYIKHGYIENAENLAREALRKILPAEVQFRLDVGGNRLTVYPSNSSEWATEFSNAEEVATAVRVSTFSPKESLKMLAWVEEDDENFMAQLIGCTNLDNESVDDIDTFWSKVGTALVNWQPGDPYYDVIFIPDAGVELDGARIANLVRYQELDGRLVVGGQTLYNSQFPDLWESLGVQWDAPPRETWGQPLDNMRILDGDNFVTLPYENGDNIEYNENYTQYVYTSINNSYVVARWDEIPPGVPENLPGIIVRPAGYNPSWQRVLPQPAVLFNMRFAQSAMDADNPMGTADWITLVKRAIGYEEVLEPITLHVWRGQVVE